MVCSLAPSGGSCGGPSPGGGSSMGSFLHQNPDSGIFSILLSQTQSWSFVIDSLVGFDLELTALGPEVDCWLGQ